MPLPSLSPRPLPLLYRVAGLVLVAGLLLLGIIGLIMPVIPGIVFLFLALYVLSRLSRRVSAYAHSKPWFRQHLRTLHLARGLSLGARIRYGALLTARGIVDSLDSGWRWLRRLSKAGRAA